VSKISYPSIEQNDSCNNTVVFKKKQLYIFLIIQNHSPFTKFNNQSSPGSFGNCSPAFCKFSTPLCKPWYVSTNLPMYGCKK